MNWSRAMSYLLAGYAAAAATLSRGEPLLIYSAMFALVGALLLAAVRP